MPARHLSPIPHPIHRSSIGDRSNCGFVDEFAVQTLLAGPRCTRPQPPASDLALPADDWEDFAGWTHQARLSAPDTDPSLLISEVDEVIPEPPPLVFRRATPPESGLGEPLTFNATQRWWLAGASGVVCCLLFSILLIVMSNRPKPAFQRPTAPASIIEQQLPAVPLPEIKQITGSSTDAAQFSPFIGFPHE